MVPVGALPTPGSPAHPIPLLPRLVRALSVRFPIRSPGPTVPVPAQAVPGVLCLRRCRRITVIVSLTAAAFPAFPVLSRLPVRMLLAVYTFRILIRFAVPFRVSLKGLSAVLFLLVPGGVLLSLRGPVPLIVSRVAVPLRVSLRVVLLPLRAVRSTGTRRAPLLCLPTAASRILTGPLLASATVPVPRLALPRPPVVLLPLRPLFSNSARRLPSRPATLMFFTILSRRFRRLLVLCSLSLGPVPVRPVAGARAPAPVSSSPSAALARPLLPVLLRLFLTLPMVTVARPVFLVPFRLILCRFLTGPRIPGLARSRRFCKLPILLRSFRPCPAYPLRFRRPRPVPVSSFSLRRCMLPSILVPRFVRFGLRAFRRFLRMPFSSSMSLSALLSFSLPNLTGVLCPSCFNGFPMR